MPTRLDRPAPARSRSGTGRPCGPRRRGRRGGGRTGHRPVQAGQGGAQEQRRALGVQRAKALPAVVGHLGPDRRGQGRVVGVGDRIQVLGGKAGLGQAPGSRSLGQLPGGEGHRQLAVLAPGEPLLLGRRHHLAVDDQGSGRVMEDSIHPKDTHLVILRRNQGSRDFEAALRGGIE